jgi:uroporphyrinogen-III synthase
VSIDRPDPSPDAPCGLRVVVTRPREQGAEWVQRLRAAGVDAVALPLLEIGKAPDPAALATAWSGLAGHRLVLFVSPNAAQAFFAAAPSGARWPPGLRAASPGPGTTEALVALGVPAAQIDAPADDAAQFDSAALWARLAARDWRGASVLVVRGNGGRDWLAARLIENGAHVANLAAYERGPPRLRAAETELLATALAKPAAHAWLFSSSEAIDRLEALVADRAAVAWSAAHAVATHPRIAERARQLGIVDVRESRPDVAAVLACIQSIRT